MSKDQKIAARKIVDDMIEQCSRLMGNRQALRLLFPEVYNESEFQDWDSRLQGTMMYPYGIIMLKNISDELTKEIGDDKEER